MRQVLVKENDPPRGVSISTLARDYPRGSNVSLHAHYSEQLVYASCGVMEVASSQSVWLIPPHFALWIPARIPHQIRMPERDSLASLCKSVGVGVRTLQRAFRRDIGMDFESWRRQVRLMKAVELLVAGRSVKEVAFLVGYQEPSAFVALFRGAFGDTPKKWV